MSSIGPKYLISDEIRIKITPENLDKYLTVSKKRLEQLNRQQIADWYLYKKSESLEADTEQKQETAVRKRRTDILKFLSPDKPIEDLIGKDALKEGKKNLSERVLNPWRHKPMHKPPIGVAFVDPSTVVFHFSVWNVSKFSSNRLRWNRIRPGRKLKPVFFGHKTRKNRL